MKTSQPKPDTIRRSLKSIVSCAKAKQTSRPKKIVFSTLAENREEVHHPTPEALGYHILKHYMQVRGLRQIDLQPILGSRGVTSEIVNGKRSINDSARFSSSHPRFLFDLIE